RRPVRGKQSADVGYEARSPSLVRGCGGLLTSVPAAAGNEVNYQDPLTAAPTTVPAADAVLHDDGHAGLEHLGAADPDQGRAPELTSPARSQAVSWLDGTVNASGLLSRTNGVTTMSGGATARTMSRPTRRAIAATTSSSPRRAG